MADVGWLFIRIGVGFICAISALILLSIAGTAVAAKHVDVGEKLTALAFCLITITIPIGGLLLALGW